MLFPTRFGSTVWIFEWNRIFSCSLLEDRTWFEALRILGIDIVKSVFLFWIHLGGPKSPVTSSYPHIHRTLERKWADIPKPRDLLHIQCGKLKTTSVTWKISVSRTLFIDWSGQAAWKKIILMRICWAEALLKEFSIWKGSGWERRIKIKRREGGGWCSKVAFASFDFAVDSHSKPPRCMLVMWPTKED